METHTTWHFRIGALILGLAIVFGALYVRYVMPNTSPEIPHSLAATSSPNILSIDTDEDGFPDWREALYGSDPLSATSTPDSPSGYKKNTSTASSTPSESFARALLTQYLYASNNGTSPVSSVSAVGQQVADSTAEVPIEYSLVLASKIKTVPASASARATYTQAYEAAVAPIAAIDEPEIGLYVQYVNGNKGAGEMLQDVIAIYSNTSGKLANMSVPQDALSAHLGATNALGYYAAVLDAMYTHSSDPVASLILLRSYNEAEQYMFDSFAQLQIYLSNNTVSQ